MKLQHQNKQIKPQVVTPKYSFNIDDLFRDGFIDVSTVSNTFIEIEQDFQTYTSLFESLAEGLVGQQASQLKFNLATATLNQLQSAQQGSQSATLSGFKAAQQFKSILPKLHSALIHPFGDFRSEYGRVVITNAQSICDQLLGYAVKEAMIAFNHNENALFMDTQIQVNERRELIAYRDNPHTYKLFANDQSAQENYEKLIEDEYCRQASQVRLLAPTKVWLHQQFAQQQNANNQLTVQQFCDTYGNANYQNAQIERRAAISDLVNSLMNRQSQQRQLLTNLIGLNANIGVNRKQLFQICMNALVIQEQTDPWIGRRYKDVDSFVATQQGRASQVIQTGDQTTFTSKVVVSTSDFALGNLFNNNRFVKKRGFSFRLPCDHTILNGLLMNCI